LGPGKVGAVFGCGRFNVALVAEKNGVGYFVRYNVFNSQQGSSSVPSGRTIVLPLVDAFSLISANRLIFLPPLFYDRKTVLKSDSPVNSNIIACISGKILIL
jgi:hypothetical protein